jgi:hypothetical protein
MKRTVAKVRYAARYSRSMAVQTQRRRRGLVCYEAGASCGGPTMLGKSRGAGPATGSGCHSKPFERAPARRSATSRLFPSSWFEQLFLYSTHDFRICL